MEQLQDRVGLRGESTIVQDHPRGHHASPRTSPERPAIVQQQRQMRLSAQGQPQQQQQQEEEQAICLVTIFTKENCSVCEAAKDELLMRNIPFQEITLEATETQPVPEFFLNNDPVPGGLDELVYLMEMAKEEVAALVQNNDESYNHRSLMVDDSRSSLQDFMGESSRRSPHSSASSFGASHRSFYDPMGDSRKSHSDNDEDYGALPLPTSVNTHTKDEDKCHDSLLSITEEAVHHGSSINESFSTAYSRERSIPGESRSFQDHSRRASAHPQYDSSHRSLSFEDALEISKSRQLSSRNLDAPNHYYNSSNNSSSRRVSRVTGGDELDGGSDHSLSTDDIAMPLSSSAVARAHNQNSSINEGSMPALMPVGMSSSSRLSSSTMSSNSRLASSARLSNIRRRMQDSSSNTLMMHESFNSSMASVTPRTTPPPESQTPIELPDKKRKVSILDATKELCKILPRTDKKYGMKVYRDAFTGSEAIGALSRHYGLSKRDALALGIHLHHTTLIHHVNHEHQFEDTNKYFYRLQCHHTPNILNSYCIWQHQETRTKHSKEVIERLHESLQRIFTCIADAKTGNLNYKRARQLDQWDEFEYQICELQLVNLARMDKKSLLAFGLNVYQLFWHFAFMKVGIPTTAAARVAFLTQVQFNVGGDIYSFSDWWNGILRGNRKSPYGGAPFKQTKDHRIYLSLPNPVDPRIHFASAMTQLTRPLQVYTGSNVDKELQMAARAFCTTSEFVSLDVDTNTLKLHHCFEAYAADFAPSGKALPKAIVQWLPKKSQAQFDRTVTALGNSLKLSFQKDDDWSQHAGEFQPFDETKELKADTKRLLTKNNSLRKLFASS